MSDKFSQPDTQHQWNRLLSGSTGSAPSPAFQENLLRQLRARQVSLSSENQESSPVADQSWQRLLASTQHASARPEFALSLLRELREKMAADGIANQTVSDQPEGVRPREYFQDHLLINLKARQHAAQIIRSDRRRYSIFAPLLSGLAAAVLLLLLGNIPFSTTDSPVVLNPETTSALALVPDTPPVDTEDLRESVASVSPVNATPVLSSVPPSVSPSPGTLVAAAYNPTGDEPVSYDLDAIFALPALPKTVRGVGVEIDDGNGWKVLDESRLTRLAPGLAFRSIQNQAGLEFGNGSTILMQPEAILVATSEGFSVKQGELAVNVPVDNSESLRLHFPERDLAVEPGTMLVVNAFYPDRYADGGAPAPEVKILDGGLAFARGKSGNAPLLANQVYLIDKYVTPDLPSRPLCRAECDAMENYGLPTGLQSPGQPQRQIDPRQLVMDTGAFNRDISTSASPSGFRQEGNRWVAKTYSGQPTIPVKYLSNPYFGLAATRRDLGSALALGPNVVIDNGEGVFYEIQR
ncbi:MAG: hypothetical protein LBU79_00715 [Planctomycetota bacterium]|jgi:hypothetical protein|nr:hypothetical protein [Planctomycetota bacterium]